ncbi:Major facilitator superfamily like protein [Aduncisulcus paluster]|uniref:Major facilitator superfamily like protein n=1 Tax=Aduncisulcus paluster TaxID=2918883 RepID=A0ABQ5KJC0_9EUKA|nr:Major facilitator superfamily like protein [Aduncisulcus paluster]
MVKLADDLDPRLGEEEEFIGDKEIDPETGIVYLKNHMQAGLLMTVLAGSLILSAMDLSIISVCLYDIGKTFGVDESSTEWITLTYNLALSAGSTIAGKIGDRYGTVIVHRIGMFFFIIFSAFCGIGRWVPSPYGIPFMAAMRAFQGLAASLLITNNMSLMIHFSRHDSLPSCQVLATLFMSIATAIGPVLGGIFAQYIGWEWCFFINLPLGIIWLILGWVYLPPVKKIKEAKFDIVGAVFLFVSLVIVVFGISWLENSIWLGILIFLIGCASLAGTIVWEYYQEFPILPIPLLLFKPCMSSLVGAFITFAAQACCIYQVPQLMQHSYNFTTTEIGLCYIPMSIFLILGSVVCGIFMKKYIAFYEKLVSVLGQGLFLFLMAAVTKINAWLIAAMLCFVAMFLGSFQTVNTGYVLGSAPVNLRGVASGLVSTFREMGYAAGTSIAICVQDLALEAMGDDPSDLDKIPAADFEQASMVTYIVMGIIALLSLLCLLMSPHSPHEVHLKGHPEYKPGNKPRIGTKFLEINARKYFADKKRLLTEKSRLLDSSQEDD